MAHFPGRAHRPATAALVVALSLILASASAVAQQDDHVLQHLADAPNPFNGSFAEWSIRGGPVHPSHASASTGWSGELGFRSSFPMYVGDHRIYYGYARWTLDDHTIQMHGLHATLGIHPFYLALLSEGWLSHFLASLHLELGLGPRLGRLTSESEADHSVGITGSVGAGFDLPLTNANRGRSLWLNTNYRRSWTTLRFAVDGGSPRLHDHTFSFGLAWRSNGIFW